MFDVKMVSELNLDADTAQTNNGYLSDLQSLLLEKIEPTGALQRSKVAWKVQVLAQSYLYRLCDLAQGCCASFNNQNFVSALTLARAIIETAATLYCLNEDIQKQIAHKNLKKIDDLVMRGTFATRLSEWLKGGKLFEAQNILSAIDKMDAKLLPGMLRETYDNLSEYAHPNRLGHTQMYSQIDYQTTEVHFKKSWFLEAQYSLINISFIMIGYSASVYKKVQESLEKIADISDDERKQKANS